MSSFIEKKRHIIAEINACNLQNYEHSTSQPILLIITGEPRKFIDRLSRVIEIEQLVPLIECTIRFAKTLLIDIKKQFQGDKFNKQAWEKKQMIDCIYDKLRAEFRRYTHLEWIEDDNGKPQKCCYHVTNKEVESTLGYIFILFGTFSKTCQDVIIDNMAQLLREEQIDFLDTNKPIEWAVYFPEENGSWELIEKYVKNKVHIEHRGTIHKSTTPQNPALLICDIRKHTRYIVIFYTLPYIWIPKNDRIKSVMIYEKDWPKGAIIIKK